MAGGAAAMYGCTPSGDLSAVYRGGVYMGGYPMGAPHHWMPGPHLPMQYHLQGHPMDPVTTLFIFIRC